MGLSAERPAAADVQGSAGAGEEGTRLFLKEKAAGCVRRVPKSKVSWLQPLKILPSLLHHPQAKPKKSKPETEPDSICVFLGTGVTGNLAAGCSVSSAPSSCTAACSYPCPGRPRASDPVPACKSSRRVLKAFRNQEWQSVPTNFLHF